MKERIAIIIKDHKKGKHMKESKKIALCNMRMLHSGKIKFASGEVINLKKEFSEDNVIKNTTIGRLQGIISQESKKNSDDRNKPEITTIYKDGIGAGFLSDSDSVPTFIVTSKKKDISSVFNYLNPTLLGFLLNHTTLPYQYKMIKNKWIDLNKDDDDNNLTNILYFKNVIYMMSQYNPNHTFNRPLKVNVIVLAFPKPKNLAYVETVDSDMSKEDIKRMRVITDILEAGIKCGCKDLIINPFEHITLNEDYIDVMKCWKACLSTKRSSDFLKDVRFVIDNDKELSACIATFDEMNF